MEHVLERSLWVPAGLDEVFGFFSDAGNLERITPAELRFRIETPLPIEMKQGAEIRYRLSLFGVAFGWTTEITRWEPGRCFVDRQRRGPYRVWEHTHWFEARDGGTTIRDEVHYALPLQPFGELAHGLVRRQLDRIFDHRTETVRRIFPRPSAAEQPVRVATASTV
jgi:ligand-binding SRPBCC domain-containing protein